MKYVSRRSFLAGAAASGALPLFNIGCAGFGQGRARQIAQGAKIRGCAYCALREECAYRKRGTVCGA